MKFNRMNKPQTGEVYDKNSSAWKCSVVCQYFRTRIEYQTSNQSRSNDAIERVREKETNPL